jgi:hypothetical protein
MHASRLAAKVARVWSATADFTISRTHRRRVLLRSVNDGPHDHARWLGGFGSALCPRSPPWTGKRLGDAGKGRAHRRLPTPLSQMPPACSCQASSRCRQNSQMPMASSAARPALGRIREVNSKLPDSPCSEAWAWSPAVCPAAVWSPEKASGWSAAMTSVGTPSTAGRERRCACLCASRQLRRCNGEEFGAAVNEQPGAEFVCKTFRPEDIEHRAEDAPVHQHEQGRGYGERAAQCKGEDRHLDVVVKR